MYESTVSKLKTIKEVEAFREKEKARLADKYGPGDRPARLAEMRSKVEELRKRLQWHNGKPVNVAMGDTRRYEAMKIKERADEMDLAIFDDGLVLGQMEAELDHACDSAIEKLRGVNPAKKK